MKSLALASLLGLASFAASQTNASGSIATRPVGASYTSDISLLNTGTTSLDTLWYAWVPGQDYLPLAPTATSSPAGWSAPGATLSGFTLTTTTTPAELTGNSIYGAHPLVGTSFVYSGDPFGPGAKKLVIVPVPEPATLAALLPALTLRRRAQSPPPLNPVKTFPPSAPAPSSRSSPPPSRPTPVRSRSSPRDPSRPTACRASTTRP